MEEAVKEFDNATDLLNDPVAASKSNGEAKETAEPNKNLDGVQPWLAPELVHSMWLLELERWLILKAATLDNPTDEKDARKRRAIYELLVRGLSDKEEDAISDPSWLEAHKQKAKVSIEWTKTEIKALKKLLEDRLAKPTDQSYAFRWNTRQAWLMTDVIDRIGYVLTGK